jgi:beta-phosphoglucomutase family hydrolase
LRYCRGGKNHPETQGLWGSIGRRHACGRDESWDQTNRFAVIGLPGSVRACLFDLDGVLTRTATIHAAAWKEMFDGYLRGRAARTGEEFVPFDPIADYDRYVDGKPRDDGVRSFLAARGIELAEGGPGDPTGAETAHALANRKNEMVLRMIREGGVRVYEGSVRYLEAAREAGLRRAVVSSSANAHDVLVAADIEGFFEARIDGLLAEREGLKGKPAPDTFLAGARALSVAPSQAAVFEDALAGVAAGRAGGFAFVVGVDRVGQAEALRERGASIVVSDLSELLEDL